MFHLDHEDQFMLILVLFVVFVDNNLKEED